MSAAFAAAPLRLPPPAARLHHRPRGLARRRNHDLPRGDRSGARPHPRGGAGSESARAVLEANPDALAIADALDAVQWSTDRLRPLHCVTSWPRTTTRRRTSSTRPSARSRCSASGPPATPASSRACATLARSCSGRRTWTSGPTVRRAARRAAGNDRRTARAAGSVQPPARRAEHLGPPVQAGGRGLVPWPGRRRAGRLPGRDRRREPPAAGGWQGADPREREPRTEGAGAARPDLRPVACRRTAALLPPDSGLPVLSVPGPAMPGNQRVGITGGRGASPS